MQKTQWVRPGKGAFVSKLMVVLGAGQQPSPAASFMVRTSLQLIDDHEKVLDLEYRLTDPHDRLRAIEALERVGVRVKDEVMVAAVSASAYATLVDAAQAGAAAKSRIGSEPGLRWPELAEDLLSAAQAVCTDVRSRNSRDFLNENDQTGEWVVCDKPTFDQLMQVVADVHNEAVEIIEREKGRNR